MPTILQRVKRAMSAARDAYLADTVDVDVLSYDGYGTFAERRLRYKFLEAVYNQNAFKLDVSIPLRFEPEEGRESYTFIRDVLGIGYGLGEFHATTLMGGPLDPAAGDGRATPSALPILMAAGRENPDVRAGLSTLWKYSNWGTRKDLVSHLGATLGDVFVEAVDDFDPLRDPSRNRVRLNVVHPSRIRDIEKDPEDNVQAYTYEWTEKDDADPKQTVTYNEECWKEGGKVWYRTYKGRRPYAWPTNPFEGEHTWSVPYSFIPLVHYQHKDVGLSWGQAEVEPALVGWRELADLASCMTDWARRAFNSLHLVAGMTAPEVNNQPRARDKTPYLYASNHAAHAESLVTPLPVGDLTLYLRELRQKQREDYPEIALQVIQSTGSPSGESIRRAREPAAAKVRKRRASYHGPSRRIFQMALSIMAVRGYEGGRGLTAESFRRNEMEFEIGPTPVFGMDPIEEMQVKAAEAAAMEGYVRAGMPLEFVMARFGYAPQDIDGMTTARDRAARAALANMRASQQLALADLDPENPEVEQ